MTGTEDGSSFGTTDALLTLMALIWAVNFSVIKYATAVFSPLAFTGLRVGIAAAVLMAIAFFRRRPWPPRRDIITLMLLGILGNGLYQIFFVEGLSRTNVGNAVLIVAAAPAFIAVASRLKGIERVRRRTLYGVALSVGGVALVVFGSARGDHSNATLLGTLLVFVGVFCWTAFTVMLQPLAIKTDPVHLSALTMTGGVLPLLIASPRALAATKWETVGPAVWASLFYASVISMVVAYLFWYRGLRVLGPTRTAVYSNLQPAIAIIVAWIFLHESPTLWQGVGTGTIMTGIFLTRT
ncbi:MAG TPA: DMT family transporter [Gemmatimonadaceae bacterium]|nr:DMT family transporter [Gemmatimonadaceae bacterium]